MPWNRRNDPRMPPRFQVSQTMKVHWKMCTFRKDCLRLILLTEMCHFSTMVSCEEFDRCNCRSLFHSHLELSLHRSYPKNEWVRVKVDENELILRFLSTYLFESLQEGQNIPCFQVCAIPHDDCALPKEINASRLIFNLIFG